MGVNTTMKKYAVTLLGFLFCITAVLSAQDQETIWNSKDESFLIQVIEKPGNTPEDVFLKNLACKRLAIVGTENAIPALTAMLSDEIQNLNARTALEVIPGEAVDQALINSLSTLNGLPLVGVINTLAMRSTPAAVLPLADVLAGTDDDDVKKAVYSAWGYIATDESIGLLTAQLLKDPDQNYKVNAALADALIRAAAKLDKAGNAAGAAELCKAVATSNLPQFDKNGGLYNELLYLRAGAAEKLSALLAEGNDNDFEVALKTVREYSADDAQPIVSAALAVCPNLSKERRISLIAALSDRTDVASQNLVLPYIIELLNDGDAEIVQAAVKASGRCGQVDPIAVYDALSALYASENSEPFDAIVEAIAALPDELADKPASLISEKAASDLSVLSNLQKQALLAQMKVVELRRIAAASSDLLTIANAEGVDPEIRDHAVAALSEIVTLDEWNFLVQALEREQDEAKVDWYLRAACTRLPREDCAATVVAMYNEADRSGKEKLLSLLKQIGGPTALAAVASAASDPKMADKATEILGQWNTPEDAAPLAAACLKLAKSGSRYKTRAIRAYIRIPRQFDLSNEQRINMAKIAFDTAIRPEDKELIFEIFKRMINTASVNAALSYADQPEYSEKACDAAVFVAEKIQGTSPELQEAMKKVVEIAKSQELKDRAAKVLQRQ
jgi:hypothetical protein